MRRPIERPPLGPAGFSSVNLVCSSETQASCKTFSFFFPYPKPPPQNQSKFSISARSVSNLHLSPKPHTSQPVSYPKRLPLSLSVSYYLPNTHLPTALRSSEQHTTIFSRLSTSPFSDLPRSSLREPRPFHWSTIRRNIVTAARRVHQMAFLS